MALSSRASSTREAAVEVYTDGSASPNPGPGGWAVILAIGSRRKTLSGRAAHTTNNRMELTAALEALRALPRPSRVRVHTDSEYLRLGITRFLPAWVKRGWRTQSGAPVANDDLWKALSQALMPHQVEWVWLRGHAGDPLNEEVDRLARQAMRAREKAPASPSPGAAPEAWQLLLGASARAGCQATWWFVGRRGAEVVRGQGRQGASANEALLHAVLAGLRALKDARLVVVRSNSHYLLQGAARSLPAWRAAGWVTSAKKPLRHRELWAQLARALEGRKVEWEYDRFPAQSDREGAAPGVA